MDVRIEASWQAALRPEFEKPYFSALADFVRQEYRSKTVFPPPKAIFRAFELCPFDQVKVVLLGQDPYHGPGQAHGLCFSVSPGVPPPPSLVNIYTELQSDLGLPKPPDGNLEPWARQGVFLLNATLTVRAGQAGSHQGEGWEVFTDEAIRLLAEKRSGLVFLLWGAYAQKKAWMIDPSKHLVLQAPHPSPLSSYRGFFGSRPFSQANDYLKSLGKEPIVWA